MDRYFYFKSKFLKTMWCILNSTLTKTCGTVHFKAFYCEFIYYISKHAWCSSCLAVPSPRVRGKCALQYLRISLLTWAPSYWTSPSGAFSSNAFGQTRVTVQTCKRPVTAFYFHYRKRNRPLTRAALTRFIHRRHKNELPDCSSTRCR